jgi:chemotaxis protein MotB
MKDKIYFQKGSTGIDEINIQVFDRLVKMLRENNWNILIEGHSEAGEVSVKDGSDAYLLSSARALAVSRSLIQRGISADRITTLFYGDSRPLEKVNGMIHDRRVEFVIRKADLRVDGKKVEAR